MTRDEAREWLADFLLDIVRADPYPSVNHLALIEQVIPRWMVSDYLDVLLEKVEQDTYPSIPLLRRIIRLTACLPDYEYDVADGERDAVG
jgi:hypothetical protein